MKVTMCAPLDDDETALERLEKRDGELSLLEASSDIFFCYSTYLYLVLDSIYTWYLVYYNT